MQETNAASQFNTQSTQRSSSVSSSNGSASTTKDPETSRSSDIEADPESDSERDLRKAVKKMTTSSSSRAPPNSSAHPERLSSIGGFKLTKTPEHSSPSSAQRPILSPSAQTQLPFKKFVSSFRYSGEATFPSPLTIDSDESLSSPDGSDGDKVNMVESPKHCNKSDSHSPSKKIKRQIISSDEEEVQAAKPRRRLVRKGDLERTLTPETSQTRRPVKRLALDSDEELPRQPSILISDDDDNSTTLDQKLAQLQATFPDTPFDVLKRALKDSAGDFASAASRVISETERQLLDLTSEPKIMSSKVESSVQRKKPQPKPLAEYRRTDTFQRKMTQLSKPHPEYSKAGTLVQRKSQPPKSPKSPKSHSSEEEEEEEEEIEVLSSSDGETDSLDDEDGPNKYVAQDRREERVLQFFNDASLVELQELTGCSKTQANQVFGLRPFGNYDQLCVILRKTKGVGERIVENYLTTTDAIRAVDMMLKTVERVREDLVGTLSVWCGDENGKLFAASNTNSNSTDAIESKSNGSPRNGEESDDNSSDPGVGLLEVDAEKVELTREGRKAMKDFIRKQPGNMAPGFQLKGYQLLGINWLALLWRKGLSGILADEVSFSCPADTLVDDMPRSY